METKANDLTRESGQYLLFENDSARDPLCFDIFFNDGPFGMLLLDRYFQVTRVNHKFCEVSAIPATAFMGRKIFDLLEEETALSLKSVLQRDHTLDTPLCLHLAFLQSGDDLLITEGYIRRYVDHQGEFNFCVLLFESGFSPNRQQLALRNELYRTIIETQEEERRNIGSALHDSVAQLLYGMRLHLQHFVMEHGNAERILPIKKMLNEVIHEIRTISMDLFPSIIEEFGLGPAIKSMADRFSFPGFRVVSIFHQSCEQISQRMKLAVYRIVQELLNNCMKHAIASRVSIRVTRGHQEEIMIEVSDNGRGFRQKVDECIEEGTGLRNIRSRIRLYQGEIHIVDNHPGTKVTIRLVAQRVS